MSAGKCARLCSACHERVGSKTAGGPPKPRIATNHYENGQLCPGSQRPTLATGVSA